MSYSTTVKHMHAIMSDAQEIIVRTDEGMGPVCHATGYLAEFSDKKPPVRDHRRLLSNVRMMRFVLDGV